MMTFRTAVQNDIKEIQRIRAAVKENILSNPEAISDEDVKHFLFKRGKGWVCEDQNEVIGFGIVDLKNNNIWALFVDPAHENKGVGKKLNHLMLTWYFEQTQEMIWLGTSPDTRAEGFYKKMNWIENGKNGVDEIRFEMTYKHWEGSVLFR